MNQIHPEMSHVTQKGDPDTYAIIGAAMEVHRQLGPGFVEAVYHEALLVELTDRHIPYRDELKVPITYKGRQLKCGYKADFVCFGRVLVEIKALTRLSGVERAQIINYLKGTGLHKGLLLNFGAGSLEFERFVAGSLNSALESAKSAESVDPLWVRTLPIPDHGGSS